MTDNWQQGMLNMMSQRAGNNPIFMNALQMYKNGDIEDLKRVVNNIAAQKGIDPQQAMSQMQNQMSGSPIQQTYGGRSR